MTTQRVIEMMQQAFEGRMDAHTQAFMRTWKGVRETRQMGQCLQAGTMAPPRAATNELKGSAPAGEDRVIRVTEKVTETVTEKLIGVTETCTRET